MSHYTTTLSLIRPRGLNWPLCEQRVIEGQRHSAHLPGSDIRYLYTINTLIELHFVTNITQFSLDFHCKGRTLASFTKKQLKLQWCSGMETRTTDNLPTCMCFQFRVLPCLWEDNVAANRYTHLSSSLQKVGQEKLILQLPSRT